MNLWVFIEAWEGKREGEKEGRADVCGVEWLEAGVWKSDTLSLEVTSLLFHLLAA